MCMVELSSILDERRLEKISQVWRFSGVDDDVFSCSGGMSEWG